MRAALAENSAEPVSILDAIGNRFPPAAQLYASHKSNVNGSSERNKNESSEMPERIVAADVAYVTDEFGHEGTPRGDVGMKKSLLGDGCCRRAHRRRPALRRGRRAPRNRPRKAGAAAARASPR